MDNKEKNPKVLKRYSLILDIIPFEGEIISCNYYDFLMELDADLKGKLGSSSPLAEIDKYTILFDNEEVFNQNHKNFFNDDYCFPKFLLSLV